jgi:hypothetical protein
MYLRGRGMRFSTNDDPRQLRIPKFFVDERGRRFDIRTLEWHITPDDVLHAVVELIPEYEEEPCPSLPSTSAPSASV